MEFKRKVSLPILLSLFTIYSVWSSTFLAIRIGLESFPPFMMAGLRFVIAGAILYFVLRLLGSPPPTFRQWVNSAILGALLLMGGNGGVCFAEKSIPSGLAALGAATIPLWTALFIGMLDQWPSRNEMIGLGLGFIGVILLNFEGNLKAHPSGEIALFVSALCWAFGSAISRRMSLPKGFLNSAAQMMTGGMLLLLLSQVTGEKLVQLPKPQAWGAVGYLILFGSVFGYCAYLYLLEKVSPSVATSYAYVNPFFAMLLGWKFAGEPLTWHIAISASFILGSVLFLTVFGKGKKKEATQESSLKVEDETSLLEETVDPPQELVRS